jgi:hypothetical protein
LSPLYRLRPISACLQVGLYPFEKLRHSLLLDGSQRVFIHARRSLIPAHQRPSSPQDVTPVDPVIGSFPKGVIEGEVPYMQGVAGLP